MLYSLTKDKLESWVGGGVLSHTHAMQKRNPAIMTPMLNILICPQDQIDTDELTVEMHPLEMDEQEVSARGLYLAGAYFRRNHKPVDRPIAIGISAWINMQIITDQGRSIEFSGPIFVGCAYHGAALVATLRDGKTHFMDRGDIPNLSKFWDGYFAACIVSASPPEWGVTARYEGES